jgi:hypothetical protein
MTTLVSNNPDYEVRTARTNKKCWAADKWFHSPLCTGRIRKGSVYVAKQVRAVIAGRWQWIADERKYCAHCALKTLGCIRIGEEKVAA